MALCLHSIWHSRTVRLYSDVDARSEKQYFRESVGHSVEVIKSQEISPVWRPIIEQLTSLKKF